MATATPRSFRVWLGEQLETQGVARRELARRLAAKHPGGATHGNIETYRRAIYRYLDPSDPMLPNAQTRSAFAAALDVPEDEVPSSDDEEEDSDLAATLQMLAREYADMSRRLARAMKAVKA